MANKSMYTYGAGLFDQKPKSSNVVRLFPIAPRKDFQHEEQISADDVLKLSAQDIDALFQYLNDPDTTDSFRIRRLAGQIFNPDEASKISKLNHELLMQLAEDFNLEVDPNIPLVQQVISAKLMVQAYRNDLTPAARPTLNPSLEKAAQLQCRPAQLLLAEHEIHMFIQNGEYDKAVLAIETMTAKHGAKAYHLAAKCMHEIAAVKSFEPDVVTYLRAESLKYLIAVELLTGETPVNPSPLELVTRAGFTNVQIDYIRESAAAMLQETQALTPSPMGR